jgi:aminoglycoside phosphotransferase (APT) family kinase protein
MSQAGVSRQETFSGTKEVTAAHAFDVKKLEAYLAERIAGFQTPLEVRQFKGGHAEPQIRYAPETAGKAAAERACR